MKRTSHIWTYIRSGITSDKSLRFSFGNVHVCLDGALG